ncbi:sigma factor [Thermococcus sp.]
MEGVNSLVLKAKNSTALKELVCRLYEPLILKEASKYPANIREDLIQEGRLIVLKAIDGFDFSGYVKTSVRRGLKRYADGQAK